MAEIVILEELSFENFLRPPTMGIIRNFYFFLAKLFSAGKAWEIVRKKRCRRKNSWSIFLDFFLSPIR